MAPTIKFNPTNISGYVVIALHVQMRMTCSTVVARCTTIVTQGFPQSGRFPTPEPTVVYIRRCS